MGLVPDEKKCHPQTLKVKEIYIKNSLSSESSWMDHLWNVFYKWPHGNYYLGKTYWTFQESSELGGDVAKEREKRRAEKDIQGGKKKWDRKGERENKATHFEKGTHVDQWSISKIIESWLLRVKRNTFSSLSNQHNGVVMGLKICLFQYLSATYELNHQDL